MTVHPGDAIAALGERRADRPSPTTEFEDRTAGRDRQFGDLLQNELVSRAMPKMRVLAAQQSRHFGVVRNIERWIAGSELGSRRGLSGRLLERCAQPNSSRCTPDMISSTRSLE